MTLAQLVVLGIFGGIGYAFTAKAETSANLVQAAVDTLIRYSGLWVQGGHLMCVLMCALAELVGSAAWPVLHKHRTWAEPVEMLKRVAYGAAKWQATV